MLIKFTTAFFLSILIFLISENSAWSTCNIPASVITIASQSACQVSLSWTSNPNTAYYVVRYKIKGQSNWQQTYNVGLVNSFTITNLTGNTIYVFNVTPYCSDNQAGKSAKKNATTNSCSLPGNVTVTNIENTSAHISWSVCGTSNEAFVRIKPAGTLSWTVYSAGLANSLQILSLDPDTKYIYQVNTCDTSVKKLWSPNASFTTALKPSWQPNVLLIYLDDCRYDVFGANGGPSFFNSPAINSIAEEGVNFRWCFPALSLCSPSRASIVSGLYPHHHGVYSNALVDTFPHITLSQIMHDAGYYVGFVGKYSFEKFPVPGYDYYCQSSSDEYTDAAYQYNNKNFEVIPGHKTNVFTSKALEFLDQVPDGKKFMLFLAHKAPHVPYDPRPQDEGIFDNDVMPFPGNYPKFTKNIPSHYYDCDEQYPTSGPISTNFKNYYELLNGAEWSVDTILNYLQSKNLLDSTLVIFTSDNGLLIGEHKLGGKEIVLEPSIQLPMFIRYPKWFSPNTIVTDEMAMNIDIAPTILDAAGIPDTFNMDGVSMRQLVKGSRHRKEMFYEFFYRSNCNPTFQAVRDFNYKYVHNECSETSEEFYDLTADPLEIYNLINDPSYSAKVELYRSKLDSLEEVYSYVNISDTVLNCSLTKIDSSIVVFKMNDDLSTKSSYRLFPNPVAKSITISCDFIPQTTVHLSIVNIFSTSVYEQDLHISGDFYTTSLDVSSFTPGAYVATLSYNGKQESLLFVKE